MKFQKPNTPKLDLRSSDSPTPSCPLLGIPRVNHHGMVLEMRYGFEVGSTIALGFHLQSIDATSLSGQGQSMKASPPQPGGSYFIGFEAIVIESKPGSGAVGQPVYLVTVLFSQISQRDKKRLLCYCQSHRADLRRNLTTPKPHDASPQDFDEKLRWEATQRIHLN